MYLILFISIYLININFYVMKTFNSIQILLFSTLAFSLKTSWDKFLWGIGDLIGRQIIKKHGIYLCIMDEVNHISQWQASGEEWKRLWKHVFIDHFMNFIYPSIFNKKRNLFREGINDMGTHTHTSSVYRELIKWFSSSFLKYRCILVLEVSLVPENYTTLYFNSCFLFYPPSYDPFFFSPIFWLLSLIL